MEDILVIFQNKDGSETEINTRLGYSLLEVAHLNKIDLEGACEGSLACSTCHVVVDKKWYDKLNELQPASPDEEDMLDLAFGLTPTSRLGCQIKVNKEISGLKVSIPNGNRNFSS